MSHPTHTYGPTCHLSRTVSFTGSKGDDDMPDLKPQFFYASQIGIDDPLSAVPVPSSKSKTTDHPPRPFSIHDSSILEEAWMSFSGKGKRHQKSKAQPAAMRDKDTPEQSPVSQLFQNTPAQEATRDDSLESPKSSAEAPSKENTGRSPGNEMPEDSESPPPTPSSKKSILNFLKSKTKENLGAESEGHTSDGQSSKMEPGKAPSKPVENRGNPYNKFCDDEHHVDMDMKPTCCEDFEVGDSSHTLCKTNPSENGAGKKPENGYPGQTSGNDSEDIAQDQDPLPKSKHRKRNKGKLVGHNLSEAQGDGNHDGEPSPEDDQDMQFCRDPEEHKTIERHTKCKSHQAFETHFQMKHGAPGQTNDKENKSSQKSKSGSEKRQKSDKTELAESVQAPIQANALPAQNSDARTTGRPFLRLPSRKSKTELKPYDDVSPLLNDYSATEEDGPDEETLRVPGCKAHKNSKDQINIPVGISRLHHVQLPSLQMKPIYWSPVHDIAAVTRGTWFYKDTMYPVEPAVANQLEKGYRELRAWSQTWSDELHSAIEVGAEAEEKIAHRLWPKEEQKKDGSKKDGSRKKLPHLLSADPFCAAKCFHGEAAAEGAVDWEDTDPKRPTVTVTKKFTNSQVIYKDAQNAFILKPNLQPSAYYGRKPLQKIKKGQTVGVHVVRGFDWKAWEKLYPTKMAHTVHKVEEIAPAGVTGSFNKPADCPICQAEAERHKVTDLVLVIHGIGQKLSERMESFHFTHAINSFRREVNLEKTHHDVKKVLRSNLGGIMVLPINWRTNLSFEDGGPMKDEDKDPSGQHFTLEDITPTTIPAVRNMISDVMLDIPFYMSHHKPKMIQAVVAEANRVYRLWCQNNPDFAKEGRVHIIAHSLGSAMALDILSKQPTAVPKYSPATKKVNTKFLDFNTTNLFLAGSPAGFFLLLEKAMLLPRRGQNKPDAEYGDDKDKALTGDAGSFGCLAVDNIYNIMHYNDPIAYRMNAAVDPQYAASLKITQVPSSSASFFEGIGKMIRSGTRGEGSSTDATATKPPGVERLPSQLEMEVHDFTREEIAEKKFALLNDNGQIDWFLSSGGGPLENQYINMLGAHSSYWLSQDFVRFIVVEVGREPGRKHALPHMKAVKVKAVHKGRGK